MILYLGHVEIPEMSYEGFDIIVIKPGASSATIFLFQQTELNNLKINIIIWRHTSRMSFS